MNDAIVDFLCLSASDQIQFLKEGEFTRWPPPERIRFLKQLLQSETSSKTMASALKILRELKYRDRFFFRRFLYHQDSSVANAARKAMETSTVSHDSGEIRLADMVKRENPADRPAVVRNLLKDCDTMSESLLLSLLQIEDFRVREEVVANLSPDINLDEAVLADAVNGAVWYVRSSVVQILGRRHSGVLPDLARRLVGDANVDVRLSLAEALGLLQNEETRPLLETLSKDANQWVRRRALKALAEVKEGDG
ncbi:MAG TPA: hypothetical protein ENN40_08040 [Candidatus Aminicenantes bacterium]|nr:hypothetical protein [Candidatus Aminicenantes bacterium]